MRQSSAELSITSVSALSHASRSIGELDAALHAAVARRAIESLFHVAGEEWPSLRMTMRCALDHLDLLEATIGVADLSEAFRSLDAASQWAVSAIHSAEQIRQNFVEALTHDRVSKHSLAVFDLVLSEQQLSASTVVDRLGVSPTTAGRVLQHLVRVGIANEVTGRRRNRVYCCPAFNQCFDPSRDRPKRDPFGKADDVSVTTAGTSDVFAEIVPLIVRTVFAGTDAERIIVFGSHARNEAGPDSDIDLLVVLPHVTSAHDDAVKIMRLLRDMPVSVDVLVTDRQRLRIQEKVPGIVRVALREGHNYERAA